eukprot:Awhi_evm1s1882
MLAEGQNANYSFPRLPKTNASENSLLLFDPFEVGSYKAPFSIPRPKIEVLSPIKSDPLISESCLSSPKNLISIGKKTELLVPPESPLASYFDDILAVAIMGKLDRFPDQNEADTYEDCNGSSESADEQEFHS